MNTGRRGGEVACKQNGGMRKKKNKNKAHVREKTLDQWYVMNQHMRSFHLFVHEEGDALPLGQLALSFLRKGDTQSGSRPRP